MNNVLFVMPGGGIRGVLIIVFLGAAFSLFAQLPDSRVRDAKSGRIINDTSYVYQLPWQNGKRHLLIQAANSRMSHRNELSLDFKMKTGTLIFAAREGIVVDAKADSDKGGLQEEMLSQGNHVIILHNDGSRAKYWHLQKDGVFVKTGDRVTMGQLIGASGNTG